MKKYASFEQFLIQNHKEQIAAKVDEFQKSHGLDKSYYKWYKDGCYELS